MPSELPVEDPFQALGDPNRRRIVELLAEAPRSVGDLADEMPISRPAVSRHLRLLKDAGLVSEVPDGTRRIYRLHDEGVVAVEAYLRAVWGEAMDRFRIVAENTTPTAVPAVIEPLRLSVEVGCAPEHAFGVWTERFGSWWPRGHNASGHPDTQVVLEPGVGGRIYERLPDGTEIDWGEIVRWEAPRRLAYRWHIRRDPTEATDVVIDFVAAPGGGTRVDITQTGWERLGAEGPSWREANASGWHGLLPHFTAACPTGT